MHKWIETVCATKVDTIFWDEPHFYFEKGGLQNWSCRCEKCREMFRAKFGYEMPVSSSLSITDNGDAKIKDGRHRINVKIEINFFMILCY